MVNQHRRRKPDRSPEQEILAQFLDLCGDLHEVIEDRKEWHANGHQKDCHKSPCQEDPLYHEMMRLNWEVKVKRIGYIKETDKICSNYETGEDWKDAEKKHEECSHRRVAEATLIKVAEATGIRQKGSK